MEDNVEKFLELYNDFDDYLRRYFRDLSRSYSAITRYIVKLRNSSNEKNVEKANKVDQIRVLRNDLVHEFDMNSRNLIKITDETIDFLRQEIENFKHPITAYKICTKTAQLNIANLDDPLSVVLKIMLKEGHTQVPLLNEDGSLLGTFSPNTIFQYVGHNDKDIKGTMLIKDFEQYLPLQRHISETYCFINANCPIDDLLDIFDKYYRKGKKLQAVFVTKNGSHSEPLLGMIVSFDLLKNID